MVGLVDSRGRPLVRKEAGQTEVRLFGARTTFIPTGFLTSEGTRGLSAAIDAYPENPQAYGPIAKIARDIAGTPWVVLRPKRKKRSASPREWARRRRGYLYRNADELVAQEDYEIVEGPSRLREVWEAGNEFMSDNDVRFTLVANYLLAGAVYLLADPDRVGRPAQLYPFPARLVTAGREKSDTVTARDERVVFANVPKDRAWLWRDINPGHPYSSVASLGGAIATELGIDEHAAQCIARRFRASGTPPGMWILRGASDPDIDEFRDEYAARSNIEDVGRPLAFNEDVDWKPISETLADLSLETVRTMSTRRIRQAAGIPPEIMGDVENSNRATAREASLIYADRVLEPLLADFSRFINRYLPRALGVQDEVLSFVDPSPVDSALQEMILDKVPEVLKVREIRSLAALPDEEDDLSDQYYGFAFRSSGSTTPEATDDDLDPDDDTADLEDDEDQDDED